MEHLDDDGKLDPITKKNVVQWLEGHFDEGTQNEIRRLLKENPQQIIDSFYTTLSFGTGGMRGVMGLGCNRFNAYTVRGATQGLANYLLKQGRQEAGIRVVVGYDSRHHSREFAEEAARVLAASGIEVHLFKELSPTPLVSFACRRLEAQAAIMITASHNPKEYNGYKVYWDDGAQVLPPHDKGIVDQVNKIVDLSAIPVAERESPLIKEIDDALIEEYLAAVAEYQNYREETQQHGGELRVVYSSLHGTGITMVPKILARWGFSDVLVVKEQEKPDGDFPTTASPNPEERAALALGIDLLLKREGDILLATDPDADRMGVAVRHQGKAELLDGNQIVAVLLYHLGEAFKQQQRMPAKAAAVKTIVTSELVRAVAESYGMVCADVLTGFKYIAEKIREWERDKDGYHFLFGGEESYGTLCGTHARDKDAIIACALFAEAALHAKRQGKTLVDLLHDMYRRYGIYRERLLSVKFEESKEGKERMRHAMEVLRGQPPQSLGGVSIVQRDDYQTQLRHRRDNSAPERLALPQSDVLVFWLDDATKVVVRPSGTEPKVKLYGGAVLKEFASIEEGMKACEQKVDRYLDEIRQLMGR